MKLYAYTIDRGFTDISHILYYQVFSGGEPHVVINDQTSIIRNANIWLDARPTNGNEFISMLAVLDALRAMRPAKLSLFIPYFPGARQDRREPGGCFTLKLYADLIRTANLDAIGVVDPHSDVTAALTGCRVVPQWVFTKIFKGCYDGVISPDAGASKKAEKTGETLGVPVFTARKSRNPATGLLSGFHCDTEDMIPDGEYLVVDDICDGGRTFVGLAQHIKEKLPNVKLHLYVTFGIFSKGQDELLKYYDLIFNTSAFRTGNIGCDIHIAGEYIL